MAFRIEFVNGIIFVTFEGDIEPHAMDPLLDELRAEEKRHTPVPHRIADLSAVTGGSLKFDRMRKRLDERSEDHLPNPIRTAIVAVKPIQLGYANMFRMLMKHPQITVEIFPDRESAERWIRS